MTIGEIIKRERKRQKISQMALSVKTGITQTSLSHVERGYNCRPHSENLAKIAKALDLPVELFILRSMEFKSMSAQKRLQIEYHIKAIETIIYQS